VQKTRAEVVVQIKNSPKPFEWSFDWAKESGNNFAIYSDKLPLHAKFMRTNRLKYMMVLVALTLAIGIGQARAATGDTLAAPAGLEGSLLSAQFSPDGMCGS